MKRTRYKLGLALLLSISCACLSSPLYADNGDADGDGILDTLLPIPPGFVAIDTDDDGIADTLAEDTDGDGIANFEDIDADGNGILDELGEVPPGFVAIDTDDDGIADTLALDTDQDGIADFEDIDADGNGILDELGEIPAGFEAIDTDDDGIADTLVMIPPANQLGFLPAITFLLNSDSSGPQLPIAPAGSAGLVSSIIDQGSGTSLASILTGSGKDGVSFSGASTEPVNIVDSNGTQSIASIIASSDLTNLNILDNSLVDCVNCFTQPVPANPELVLNPMTQVQTNYTVHFSQRQDTAITLDLGNGNESYNAADLVYAYSEDATPDVSSATQGVSIKNYSRLIGSNSIDQDGVLGVLGTVNLEINFGSQQITSFDLNLVTADGTWEVHLPFITGTSIQDPIALSGSSNRFAVEGLASDSIGGIPRLVLQRVTMFLAMFK